jgi:hypothetical protein
MLTGPFGVGKTTIAAGALRLGSTVATAGGSPRR